MARYQPRRAVIATVMQADFAECSTAISIFGLSPLLAKLLVENLSCTIFRSFKQQKLSSAILKNLNMSKLRDS